MQASGKKFKAYGVVLLLAFSGCAAQSTGPTACERRLEICEINSSVLRARLEECCEKKN